MCRFIFLLGLFFSFATSLYSQDSIDSIDISDIQTKKIEQSNPGDASNIGVEEKTGDFLSNEITFIDASGKKVKLSSLFNGRPVILTPVYYDCPDLCNLVLNGLLRAINNESNLLLGKDYDIISFSISPAEKDDLAFQKQKLHLGRVKNKAAKNWHFLTGDQKAIDSLTKNIGFRYTQSEKDYLHTAVLVFISPERKITRYLYGTSFRSQDFKLSLLDAAQGTVGSFSDQVLLFCYGFDPVKKKYSLVAWKVMQLGSAVIVIFVGFFLCILWFREKRKKHRSNK